MFFFYFWEIRTFLFTVLLTKLRAGYIHWPVALYRLDNYVRHVVLCQLLPRFHTPRRLLRQYHGSARQRAEAHYLRMSNQHATEINRQLFEMSAVAPSCTFWNHNHKFKFGSSAHKFATDGMPLVRSAQYQLYPSVRGAILQLPRDYTRCHAEYPLRGSPTLLCHAQWSRLLAVVSGCPV